MKDALRVQHSPLKIGRAPKGKVHLPTMNFEEICWVQGGQGQKFTGSLFL